jgi:hypothetical protein
MRCWLYSTESKAYKPICVETQSTKIRQMDVQYFFLLVLDDIEQIDVIVVLVCFN